MPGIVNPGKLLASAIGSLTQPLFYRGANIARLKQAKAQEEQAKIQFQTALLNAGNEVSNALHLYQMEKNKAVSRTIQVNSARQAASDTKELFNLGTSTIWKSCLPSSLTSAHSLQKYPTPSAACRQSSACIKRLEEEENKMSDK